MTEEHPPDDASEPEQPELDLEAQTPDIEAEETLPPADVDAELENLAADISEADDDAASEDEPAEEDLDDEPALNDDLEDLLETLEEEPTAPSIAAAAASETPPAPTSGPPTSWPKPIPIGAPAREPGRFDGLIITPQSVVLGVLVTIAFLIFVTLEPTPRWVLLFAAIVAVLGTDGVLKQRWPQVFSRSESPADSSPYLFLPALAAIAWPMLIEHNVCGYLVLPAALVAGLAYTAILIAQVSSVRITAPAYPIARLVSTGAVYFSAFSLFSLSYILDIELGAAVVATAAIATMLAVELYREGQVDPLETLVFALITGVVIAEARWALYYVPVGGHLAGLALLLGFFLVTGLVHSHLTRRLNRLIAVEYAGIAGVGVILVTAAGQAGLG